MTAATKDEIGGMLVVLGFEGGNKRFLKGDKLNGQQTIDATASGSDRKTPEL